MRCLIILVILFVLSASGQERIEITTNEVPVMTLTTQKVVVVHHYAVAGTNSVLNSGWKIKPVRTYQKDCPLCHTTTVSTNANIWIVSDGQPNGNMARHIQVSFKCPNPECDSFFQHLTVVPLPKTEMIDITDKLPPLPGP